jgi:hypothetical protein
MSKPPAPGDVPLGLVREPSKPDEHADQKVAFYCELRGPSQGAAGPGIQHAQEAVPPSRARLIDVLLYPMSFEGLVRLVIVAFGLWIVRLFPLLDYAVPHDIDTIIAMVIWYALLVWGAALYFGHCVFDSAKGSTRAPALWSEGYMYTGGDLPSMMLIGAVAFCLGLTALYGAFTRDFGPYFWIPVSAGVFFLPMLLLACTLFGNTEGLNPALIVTSIRATFPAYLGLIARLVSLAGFAGAIHWNLRRLGLPRVFPYAVHLDPVGILIPDLGLFPDADCCTGRRPARRKSVLQE